MTSASKYLQPFPLFSHLTFDEFCLEIPTFYFKKEVPEDVIRNFEIVERLLVHSYFEYKFVDEAYAKAIHTFEMAMTIRYKELNLPPIKIPGFDFLIKKLSSLNLFDTDLEVLKQVKDMRNNFSHPERHSFGGAVYWNRIEFISRLVNEMYEDVSLRMQRNDLAKIFIKQKNDLKLDKFLLMKNHLNETTILYSLSLLWINNKLTPNTYLFLCVPIFDLTCKRECQIIGPQLYGLNVIHPKFANEGMTVIDTDNNQVINFSPINDGSDYYTVLQQWKSKYESIAWNFMYDNSISMFSSSILVPELQRYQEM